MAKSSTVTAARSWPMLTSICTCRAVVDLFPRRCLISCGSMVRMECTPVICPAIPHHMVASECRTNWRSRSIKHWTSVLQSQSSAGHRGRISTFVTVLSNLNHNAVPGRGLGSRSGRNTNRVLRFTSRVRFIRESEVEWLTLPLVQRECARL